MFKKLVCQWVKNEWNYTSAPPLCLHGYATGVTHYVSMRLKILNDTFATFHLSINNFDLLLAAASLFVLHTKYLVDHSKMVVMGRTYRMFSFLIKSINWTGTMAPCISSRQCSKS